MDRDDAHPHRSAHAGAANRDPAALEGLGWEPFFAQQTSAKVISATPPVRVVAVHRSGLQVVGAGIDETIPPRPDVTVGDWLRRKGRSTRFADSRDRVRKQVRGAESRRLLCGGLRRFGPSS